MNLFEASDAMEGDALQIRQAMTLLFTILSDLEEINPLSEHGATTLALRHRTHTDLLHVLRRELDGIASALEDTAQDCLATYRKGAWIAARTELSGLVQAGVDVDAVLHTMGFKSVNEVPPELLGEVLNRAKQAQESMETTEE